MLAGGNQTVISELRTIKIAVARIDPVTVITRVRTRAEHVDVMLIAPVGATGAMGRGEGYAAGE